MKNLLLSILTILLFSSSQAFCGNIIYVWQAAVNPVDTVQDIHFLPGDNEFICTTDGNELQKRSSLTGELITSYPGIHGEFELTADSLHIVVAYDNHLELRKISDMSLVNSIDIPVVGDTVDGHGDRIKNDIINLAADPKKQYVYLMLRKSNETGYNGYIIDTLNVVVYDYNLMTQVAVLVPPVHVASDSKSYYDYSGGIDVSSDGRYVAAFANKETNISVWSPDSMKLVRNYQLWNQELIDKDEQYWCFPWAIHFSRINSDKIYFTGVFPQAGEVVNFLDGLFIYDINIDAIVDSTFKKINGGAFALFENDNKVLLSDRYNLKVLNFPAKLKEFQTFVKVDSMSFHHVIIHSSIKNIFIGINRNGITCIKYDGLADVTEPVSPGEVLYPNPTNNSVRIATTCYQPQIHYTVSDLNGQVLTSAMANATGNKLEIDFSSFASGAYYIIMSCGDVRTTYKVIKED